MDGVLACTSYAFAPNYYKYCGPDAGKGIASYIKAGASDPDLSRYLSEFAVLYPYLKLIAHENGISDPFDPRVIEAYWLGNKLLDKVGMKAFAQHLKYAQKLKMRLPPKKLKWIIEKIPKGAKIHHSFHVFSIFTRTGHQAVDHTLDTMDSCRIGWGKVTKLKVKNLKLQVMSQRLVYEDGKLRFQKGVKREVRLPFESYTGKNLQPGDLVSFHWGFVCGRISARQANNIEYYTNLNLELANQTI